MPERLGPTIPTRATYAAPSKDSSGLDLLPIRRPPRSPRTGTNVRLFSEIVQPSRPATFAIDITLVSADGKANISTRTDLQPGGHDMLPDHRPSRDALVLTVALVGVLACLGSSLFVGNGVERADVHGSGRKLE
jgi:hypothetical protein